MPPNHGLRFDDCQSITDCRDQPNERHKDQSIDVRQTHPFRCLAPEDINLLTEDQNFRFKASPALEQRRQNATQQDQNIDHSAKASPRSLLMAGEVLGLLEKGLGCTVA